MRATAALVIVAFALAFAPAHAHHGDTLLPYVDASGEFVAGLAVVGVEDVNLARLTFAAHPCHPDLQILLAFSPTNATLDAEEAALVVPFRFQIELFDDATGEPLEDAVFEFASPQSVRYALPPEHARGSPVRLDLYLLTGSDVDWSLSVRGWLAYEGCVVVSEVEANPLGSDVGHEWVELANLGFSPVDVSGWRVRALHGLAEELVLPAGTMLEGNGRLVVALPSQFLDNVDEVVVLEAPDGVAYARTPALGDAADDARTHQLTPETGAVWEFRAGTPGTTN